MVGILDQNNITLVQDLARFIDMQYGSDITILDLRNVSSISDFFIIATSRSTTHQKGLVNAIMEHASHQEREHVQFFLKGKSINEDWSVLDYALVLIHIFSAEKRRFYALEDLWKAAPKLEW